MLFVVCCLLMVFAVGGCSLCVVCWWALFAVCRVLVLSGVCCLLFVVDRWFSWRVLVGCVQLLYVFVVCCWSVCVVACWCLVVFWWCLVVGGVCCLVLYVVWCCLLCVVECCVLICAVVRCALAVAVGGRSLLLCDVRCCLVCVAVCCVLCAVRCFNKGCLLIVGCRCVSVAVARRSLYAVCCC